MRRLFRLWRRSNREAELDVELAFHLEELTAANKAGGMEEAEARHKAALELGTPQRVKERCRDVLWISPLEDALRDSALALRLFGKTRALSTMTVLALTLGIACSTIVFSVVYNGLLHPFPYRGAERLVTVRVDDSPASGKGYRYEFGLDEIAAFRAQSRSFEDFVGYGNWYATYAHDQIAEVLHGGAITPNGPEFFGVQPMLGRTFTKEESQAVPVGVVLLNYGFWKKQFGGDARVIGVRMMLDGRARTVIGVMPQRFQLLGADLWMPVPWDANQVLEENEPHYLWTTGILKRGINPQAAATELTLLAGNLERAHPSEYPKRFSIRLTSLSDAVVADFRPVVLFLAAAVLLLLLLSCSNAASLLLVKASARVKERAMQAALGATRGRLMRQSLVETLLLAASGCAAGCLLAFLGLKLVAAALAGPFLQIPREASISLNKPVLLFAIAVSLCSTLLAGLFPAALAGRVILTPQLGGTGAGVAASSLGARFRSSLVIGQVGLSAVLLICAGLMVRSFVALTHQDSGVRAANLFECGIHFPKGRYETVEQKRGYMNQLLVKLAALHGVGDTAVLVGLPLDEGPVSNVTIPGAPHKDEWDTMFELCSEGYFRTLGLELLRGRLISAEDVASGRLVAVVNETLAKRYFGRSGAIGRRIRFDVLDKFLTPRRAPYFEIVGVVSDFRNKGLTNPAMPQAFLPYSFTGFGDRRIVVRTAMNANAIASSVRRALWTIDPNVVLFEPSTLENFIDEHVYAKPRFSLIALTVCALVGLTLAVMGITSVMAYSVSLLTHEIGVRMALGARRSGILMMVLKQGMKLVGGGLLSGFAAVFLLAPVVKWQSWGLCPLDVTTVVASAGVLCTAGLLACCFPALRALRVDANTALRCE